MVLYSNAWACVPDSYVCIRRKNMNDLLQNVPEVLLMGPGPSSVPREVYEALGTSTLGHLDPYFITIMDETKMLLRRVMKTKNPLTFPISGTGSAGMEACLVNLIERGDPVLVLINGVFGGRMAEIARRLGAEVDTMEFPWGTPVDPEQAEKQLSKKAYKIVSVVHAETSTGVRNPVKEIGSMLKSRDTLYVVDAVTSLGGMEVSCDGWGADALYSGTQKCLSCPPGLAPVSFSERALAAVAKRETEVPNWYLDVGMIKSYWEGQKRAYHHTAPINMIYALYMALGLVLSEGLENVFARHRKNHEYLVNGLKEIGIEMFVEPGFRLPMLNAVRVPDGVDEGSVRRKLREDHLIEIGAGLGPLAGKIWRIGLMGHTSREGNVDRLLDAMRKVLGR